MSFKANKLWRNILFNNFPILFVLVLNDNLINVYYLGYDGCYSEVDSPKKVI